MINFSFTTSTSEHLYLLVLKYLIPFDSSNDIIHEDNNLTNFWISVVYFLKKQIIFNIFSNAILYNLK